MKKLMADNANTAVAVALCEGCGTVQTVVREKRKGHGGMSGAAGGAVAGGVIGNQVGSSTTNTIAAVGGAVAGGLIGNEIQKKKTSKKVYVTSVKMKDGSVKAFEQEAQPVWVSGNVVKIGRTSLTRQ